MNILSFKKMRAYRSEGKILAILSVRLPKIEGEDFFAERFNRFYTELFERLSDSLQKTEKSIGITKVTVDFEPLSIEGVKLRRGEAKRRDKLVTIKRIITVRTKDCRTKTEDIDVFDIGTGAFIR